MTNSTSSKDLAGRSKGGPIQKRSGAGENRGRYVDGPHARDPSKYFYAIAPAYLQTYQNPWSARVVRGSKVVKGVRKNQKKSKLSKVLDRVMAVAITYKLSPYKKDIRRQAEHFESRRDATWAKQIGFMLIVAVGGFIGIGLRFGDWLRRIAARVKRSVANIGTQQREHVLVAAIVGVASMASIGIAGSYVIASKAYTPVETVPVQSNSVSTHPFSQAADADKNNGQGGVGTYTDCSKGNDGSSGAASYEMLTEEQVNHSQTETTMPTEQETTTSVEQSDGNEETTSSSTASTQELTNSTNDSTTESTDSTQESTDSTQESTEQDTITCLTEQTQSTLDDPLAAVEPTDDYCFE